MLCHNALLSIPGDEKLILLVESITCEYPYLTVQAVLPDVLDCGFDREPRIVSANSD